VVTPIRLYPLYCTLYYCTLTHWQPSALVALSFAFVGDFVLKFCSIHSVSYSFHTTFSLVISLRNHQLFSVGSKQRATTMLDLEHVTRCSYFFRCSFAQFSTPAHVSVSVILTLFALTFLCVSHSNLHLIFVLFQTCHTLINLSTLLPYSGWQFLFILGRVPI
jgi:hypothetical protein